jgi:hypothetical protein
MMGSPFNPESEYIIKHIPRNTVGAEIGVWMGNTSKKILNKASPAYLYLVDPWSIEPYKNQVNSEHESYENYLEKYSRVTGGRDEESFQAFYDKVHNDVVKMMSGYPNVSVVRKTSKEFFDTFEEKLDWIYIDGDHSYEGCYQDLTGCLKIMSPNGIIFGDDYAWKKNNGKPGVTRAVDQFIAENNFTIKQLGHREYMIRI